MRYVNLRFLACLLLLLAVLVGTVHAVHTYQRGRHAEALKNLVERAEQAGNRTLRIDYLRRYTAIVPNDVKALDDLGTLLVEAGTSNSLREARLRLAAALNLYEAQGARSDVVRMRRELVDVALSTQRFADAEFQLGQLIVKLPAPTDIDAVPEADRPAQAEFHELLARCWIAQSRWPDVVKELESAIALDASRCDAYALLAEVLATELDQASEAVSILQQMVARNPDDFRAYRIRGLFRLRALLRSEQQREVDELNAVLQAEAQLQAPEGATAPPLSAADLHALANADAVRAVELNPDDRDVLLLAMHCAHRFRTSPDRNEVETNLARAAGYARQVIESCAAEYARRHAEIEELLKAQEQETKQKETANGTKGEPPGDATKLSADTARKLKSEVFRPAAAAYNTLADVALFHNDTGEAIKVLNEGLEALDFDESLLLNLANIKIASSIEAENQAESAALIEKLRRRPESVPLAEFLRARQEIAAGRFAEGARALVDARQQLERWPGAAAEADMWIGECFLRLGNPADAQTAFQRAIDQEPQSVSALFGLGKALQSGDEADLDRCLQIYMQLAQRHAEFAGSGQYNELALRLISVLKTKNADRPADDPAWQPVMDIIQEFREAVQENREASLIIDLLEVEVLLARKLDEDAEKLLQAAVAREPQSARLWAALVVVQDHQWLLRSRTDPAARPDAAVATLAAAQAAIDPNSPLDRVALQVAAAQHVVVTQQENAGETLRKMAAEALAAPAGDGDAQAAQLKLIESLANLCTLLDDQPTAIELYEKLRRSDPLHFRSRLTLFDLVLRDTPEPGIDAAGLAAWNAGRVERLQALLQEIEVIDGQNALWHYGNAIVILLQGVEVDLEDEAAVSAEMARLDGALGHLTDAGKRQKRWNRLWHLRGEVLDRQRELLASQNDIGWIAKMREAADAYQNAFLNGLRSPQFISKLVIYLYQLGRFEDAGHVLATQTAAQAPNLVTLAQTAAAVSDQLGDTTQSQGLESLAVKFAQAAAEGSGALDPAVHLAYGNILLSQNRLDEAEQECHRVRELGSSKLEVWQQLLGTYRRIAGQRATNSPETSQDVFKQQLQDSLQQVLAAAQPALPRSEFSVLAGRAHQLLGNREEARKDYEAELAEVPADLRQATAGQIELLSQAANFFLQASPAAEPDAADAAMVILRRLDAEGATIYGELRDRLRKNAAATAPEDRELANALARAVPTARRLLATIMMQRGEVADLEAALQLLARNRGHFAYADEDRRLESLILSRWPRGEKRQDAIALLRSVIENSLVPSATDRLMLATMHLDAYQSAQQDATLRAKAYSDQAPEVVQARSSALSNLDAARELTRSIVLAGPRSSAGDADDGAVQDGTYLAALMQQIEILLLGQELAEAQFYVEELKKAAPDQTSTIVSDARVRFAIDNADPQVRELLLGIVASAPEDARPAVALSVSQLLEGFGSRCTGDPVMPPAADYFQAVEQLLLQVADRSADHRLMLAGFYGRRGRIDEAFALVSSNLSAVSANELANACAQIMPKIGGRQEHMHKLDEILGLGRETNPDALALKLLHADVCTWLADGTRAEALYREVLAAAPGNVVASNNLAYLLAAQKRNLDEALELMNASIGRRGKLPDLLDTRAFVRLQRGEPKLALVDLTSAVSQRPVASFLFHEAQARLADGQKSEAKSAWELAVKTGLSEESLHPLEREAYRGFQSQVK